MRKRSTPEKTTAAGPSDSEYKTLRLALAEVHEVESGGLQILAFMHRIPYDAIVSFMADDEHGRDRLTPEQVRELHHALVVVRRQEAAAFRGGDLH